MKWKIVATLFLAYAFSTVIFASNACLDNMSKHIINSNTVWLDECELHDQDVPVLVSFLQNNPKISQLYLLNNHIGDKGAILLAKVKTLQMVELGNNAISALGAKVLARSSIHIIDLQGNKFSSTAMAQNKKSEVIILG